MENFFSAGTAYTSALMDAWITTLINLLALPQYSLVTVFLVSVISATLVPLGSEPVVLALVEINPAQFWPVVIVATAGNTLGGAIDWWLGFGASNMVQHYRPQSANARALAWLQKLGPKACLLAWLPIVGDPLCTVAGWLRLPFWPCVGYMLIGKFLRYVLMTAAFLGSYQALLGN